MRPACAHVAAYAALLLIAERLAPAAFVEHGETNIKHASFEEIVTLRVNVPHAPVYCHMPFAGAPDSHAAPSMRNTLYAQKQERDAAPANAENGGVCSVPTATCSAQKLL